MNAASRGGLISVKKGALRHPVVIAAGGAALAAVLVLNVLAFLRGLESPWLLGGVIVADMLVIGENAFIACGRPSAKNLVSTLKRDVRQPVYVL